MGPDLHQAALAALLASDSLVVSFVDWVSFAFEHGIAEGLAFDQHFARQGFTQPTVVIDDGSGVGASQALMSSGTRSDRPLGLLVRDLALDADQQLLVKHAARTAPRRRTELLRT